MSSLIPEKPLLISPSLAATIGLEEAAMLSVLDELASHRATESFNGYAWLALDEATVARHFPFWTDHDIQRIGKNLSDKGVILLRSAPFVASREFHFAFNESSNEENNVALGGQTTVRAEAHNAIVHGANRIAPNWQPSDECLLQIRQLGISESFACEQITEFISYWRERDEVRHAWNNIFVKHVQRAWRSHETDFQRRESAGAMTYDWQPSQDALDVLVQHGGISREFVEDAIPEFVLYWQERGDSSRTWNSKFIQHVRRQWNRYTATVENDLVPKAIAADWQPSEDVFDVLRLANIDIDFAQNLVQEFVIFWRDSGQVNSSWNTKFLQHVKYHWAKQRYSVINNSGGQTLAIKQSTRDRSLEEDLTDRSWAYQ